MVRSEKDMRNIKLTIAYDGTAYHGWQVQPGLRTIQGVLQDRIEAMVRHPCTLIVSGRTDAGVHALGQVANFRTTTNLDLTVLQKGLNSLTPADMVVTHIEEVDEAFHARFDAKSKAYDYLLLNKQYPSPFWRHFSWHINSPLDVVSMRQAGDIIRGTHDFSSFRLSGDESRHSIRQIIDVRMEPRDPGLLVCSIEANAFMRGMVRSIVGTLVQVGRGAMSTQNFQDIFEAHDRRRASMTAPARGLFLKAVCY
jgi:tRNA pseudouridine38-40 synthase